MAEHAAELCGRFQRTAAHPACHQQQADEGVERAEDEAGFAAQRFPDQPLSRPPTSPPAPKLMLEYSACPRERVFPGKKRLIVAIAAAWKAPKVRPCITWVTSSSGR